MRTPWKWQGMSLESGHERGQGKRRNQALQRWWNSTKAHLCYQVRPRIEAIGLVALVQVRLFTEAVLSE